jgi:hypothetical protein
MRPLAIFAVIFATVGWTTSVGAQSVNLAAMPSPPQVKAVVELFTSQGCSSCPPADALLEWYANRDDVVALSFPVDYWDYLGWKDTLAKRTFSERQRAYATARGDGMVYTPQVVVNGIAHAVGSRKGDIEQAIERTKQKIQPALVPVRLHADEGKLVVEAQAAADGKPAKNATLWLAVVARRVEVSIHRGENKGKTVAYSNVVRELTPIGTWTGQSIAISIEKHAVVRPGAESCAVLLQQGPGGPIVGAALLRQW